MPHLPSKYPTPAEGHANLAKPNAGPGRIETSGALPWRLDRLTRAEPMICGRSNMSNTNERTSTGRDPGPRCVAILGPHGSGKTTLLEALLERTGAISKSGSVSGGTSVGDRSKEARTHRMGVELNVADAGYLGDTYTFLDCPGAVDFAFEMEPVLAAADVAVVVCEADPRKIPALQVVLHQLEELNVPRFVFLNKIDTASGGLRDTLDLLQTASRAPLVLRQIPIWQKGVAVGFIDLASERAFVY
eukprot:gene22603-23813_t